jgi:hypothetical protein
VPLHHFFTAGELLFGQRSCSAYSHLKMCFNKPGEEVRPKEFTTGRQGGGHRLYVLQRAKPK